MEHKETITVMRFSPRTRGIMSEDDTWYNIPHMLQADALRVVDEKLATLKRGSEIDLTLNEKGEYIDFEVMSEPEGDDDIVRLDDLIRRAHEEFGTWSINTIIDPKSGENFWLVKAVVTCMRKDGAEQHFTAHGDATAQNVQGDIVKALPRMAESRAIARALRFALGEKIVAEELPDAAKS